MSAEKTLCAECETAPATRKLRVQFDAALPEGYIARIEGDYDMCDNCYEQAIDPVLHPDRFMQPDGVLFVEERHMSTVYQGLCKGGPLDGKVQAKQDHRRFTVDPSKDDGFYVYSNARGAEPASWLWIDQAKKDKPA